MHSLKQVLVNKYIFTLSYVSQFRHICLNQTWSKKPVLFIEVIFKWSQDWKQRLKQMLTCGN
jgi:hypothetical protein